MQIAKSKAPPAKEPPAKVPPSPVRDIFFESLADGLAIFDREWRYLYLNEQGARMTGLKVEEVIGRSLWEVFPKAVGTKFSEGHHRAMETGRPVQFEEYYPEPLNRWFECRCHPSSEGLSVYFVDVTQRKRADEAMWENETLFTNLIEQAPMGVHVVDADFRVRNVNALAAPVFQSIPQVVGRDFGEVMEIAWGPEMGKQLADIFRNTLDTGEPYYSPRFSAQRMDVNEEQAYEWELRRIRLPDARYGVVCYFHDVTMRRRSEAALQARTEELESLLDVLPAFVWTAKDAECRVITGNDAANLLVGIEPGENISQTAALDGEARYLRQLNEEGEEWRVEDLPLQKAVRTGEPVRNAMLDFRFADGRAVQVLGNAVPLFDGDGKARGGIAAFHDISALRRAQAELAEARLVAEAANQRKDEFISVLSHELRTPLTPVLLSLAFWEGEDSLPKDLREDLGMMKRNLGLEVTLIDDLLDLSRVSSKKLELKSETVDVAETLRQVCEICQDIIAEKKIGIFWELAGDVGTITGDTARLHQVFWNVLKNAVKFTPECGTIRISTRWVDGGFCEVRFCDSGIGLAPESLPRIFEAFEQGDIQITKQFGGLGLGLAICRALVELHGGRIWAESDGADCGSTFVVVLPVGKGAEPQSAMADSGENVFFATASIEQCADLGA